MTEVRAFRRNAVGTESQPADKRRIGQPAGANSTVGAVQRRTAHADQNTAAAEIISMPDGFSNVAANCAEHGLRDLPHRQRVRLLGARPERPTVHWDTQPA